MPGRFCFLAALALLVVSCSQHPPLVHDTLPFAMPQIARPVIPDRTVVITGYGAVPGGSVKNTAAIQKAIDEASQQGGGVVVIPKGTWLTGALRLENNI